MGDPAMGALPELTAEEIEACRTTFDKFDSDKQGSISINELKKLLSAMSMNLSDEELYVVITFIDADGSGEIEFKEFLRAAQIHKAMGDTDHSEGETLDAFISMGGNPDKTGCVSVAKLKEVCREFELRLDIEALARELDTDGSGTVEWNEFKKLFS